MVKFILLVLLAGLVTVAVVAAPKPVKEGLLSHDAVGKAYVVRKFPDRNGEWWISTGLKVPYTIAGQPGEKYTVELWLGLPDLAIERYRGPAHFDTQEVTVPGKGDRLTEVKGAFDRRHYDRPPEEGPKGGTPPPWYELKPGSYSLVGPRMGGSWQCRLVVKKNGKNVSDTGYFRVVLPPVIDL
jgi:hypothetical protein